MTRARDVADVQENLGGAVAPFVAGKNKIINGDFGVWQRGTSFNPVGDVEMYTTDRFYAQRNGTGATVTVSRQAFTLGAAPVAGYEGTFFYRYAQTVAGTGGNYNNFCNQKIEDVRTFAGQTVTVSFWARADSTRSLVATIGQEFGTGGSDNVYLSTGTFTLTTSWVRYSGTVALPSISGKTIGSGSRLGVFITGASNLVQTIDIWGVQLEAGSVATPFTTATGTIQGELAACQRYYFQYGGDANYQMLGQGAGQSTTQAGILIPTLTQMRVTPTSVNFSTVAVQPFGAGTITAVTALVVDTISTKNIPVANITVASGLTQGTMYRLITNNSTAGYLGFSAEL
jgi:hypothetical protein